jgi:hypothetical protein
MYPPSLKRASRLITPRISPSSVEKEFFNRIGRKQKPPAKHLLAAYVLVTTGKPGNVDIRVTGKRLRELNVVFSGERHCRESAQD